AQVRGDAVQRIAVLHLVRGTRRWRLHAHDLGVDVLVAGRRGKRRYAEQRQRGRGKQHRRPSSTAHASRNQGIKGTHSGAKVSRHIPSSYPTTTRIIASNPPGRKVPKGTAIIAAACAKAASSFARAVTSTAAQLHE